MEKRHAGSEEKEAPQEEALAILDQIVITGLNASPAADVLQKRVQQLLSEPYLVGESYRVIQVGSSELTGPLFALAASFSLSGPSAVRLYAPGGRAGVPPNERATDYKLTARIDRFSHTEYFDEYLEVVVVQPAAGVFVTVTGRVDDRKTGMFMAWRFDGRQLRNLWTSDLLEYSSYEARDGELRLEFCSESDEDRPSLCKKMMRQRFGWDGGWARKSQEEFAPKPPPPPVS